MFSFKRNNLIDVKLEEHILHLLETLQALPAYSDDYEPITNQLTALMELRQKNTISKDTWVTVGSHIAGLVVLMNHERTHVIASKALSFVKKIV